MCKPNTESPADTQDINEDEAKIVAVRIKESERQKLKAFFDLRSIPLSTGFRLAAEYVMELAQAGVITVSKAGIIDRRG
jgi:hypothetical protein